MALSVTASDPQAGALTFYKNGGEPVRVTKQHVARAGGAQIMVPGFEDVLSDVLAALVTAATITAAQRTAFVAVLSAVNQYTTTQAGL